MTEWEQRLDKYGVLKICIDVRSSHYRAAINEFTQVISKATQDRPSCAAEVCTAVEAMWRELIAPVVSTSIKEGDIVLELKPSPYLMTFIAAVEDFNKAFGGVDHAVLLQQLGGELYDKNSTEVAPDLSGCFQQRIQNAQGCE